MRLHHQDTGATLEISKLDGFTVIICQSHAIGITEITLLDCKAYKRALVW